MATVTFRVKGMTCQHCVRTVTEALQGIDGITRPAVHLETGRAIVEARDEDAIRAAYAAVTEAGYEVPDAG